MECHGKSKIDAKGGAMAGRRDLIATDKWLRWPCDVVTQLTRDHAETQAALGEKINTHFIDLLPAVTKSSFETIRLAPKSLRVPLRACYLWNMRITDPRRVHMVGKGGEVTGIKLYAMKVPGVKAELPGFHPFLEQARQKGLGKNIKDTTSFFVYPCLHDQAKPIAAGAAEGAEAAAAVAEAAAPVAAGVAEAAAPLAAEGAEAAAPVVEAAAPVAAEDAEAAALDLGAELEEEMEEADVAASKELGLTMTCHLEWRTSYRRGMPEDFHAQEQKVRRLLKRKLGLLAYQRAHMKRSSQRHNQVAAGASSTKKGREKRRCAIRRNKRVGGGVSANV